MSRFFAILLCIIAGNFFTNLFVLGFMRTDTGLLSFDQKITSMLLNIILSSLFMFMAIRLGRFAVWQKVASITIVASSIIFLISAFSLFKVHNDPKYVEILESWNQQEILAFLQDFPNNVNNTVMGFSVVIISLCIAIGLMLLHHRASRINAD